MATPKGKHSQSRAKEYINDREFCNAVLYDYNAKVLSIKAIASKYGISAAMIYKIRDNYSKPVVTGGNDIQYANVDSYMTEISDILKRM